MIGSKNRIKEVHEGFLRDRLGRRSEARDDFFFVQIGACDGISFDPIHDLIVEKKWSGVLVEPVPHLFKELQSNYRGAGNLRFVNAAITNRPGRHTMYVVEPNESLPDWVKGISSLHCDRNPLSEAYWEKPEGLKLQQQGYRYEDLFQATQEIEVDGMTWEQLVSACQIRSIDLLQIDTEGHDYVILDQLDLSVLRPYCIQFEQVHLTTEERKKAISLLVENGYCLYSESYIDYIAVDESGEMGLMDRAWTDLYRRVIEVFGRK